MAGDVAKPKSASVKVFNCTSCSSPITLRAVGHSITAVCKACGAIIDSTNENFRVIQKASTAGKRRQVIPLGQRGKLHGELWEVIGYMERCDGSGIYSWSEYLLFHPMRGFRWLTEFDGHWNYVITTKSKPEIKLHSGISTYSGKVAVYLGKSYHLFHMGKAKVNYVTGEFYWQVSQGETVKVEDFISPPEILSCESSESEVTWSVGEYVNSSVVREAFNISAGMPVQLGVAPNQMSTVTEAANYSAKYWGIFAAIIFTVQMFAMMTAKNEVVYSDRIFYSPEDTERLKVSPQFEIKGLSNLKLTVAAPVNNNWLEVQNELVNDDNGESEEFEQGVEYYSGYDSDGSWTEGSQQSSLIVSSVPSGKYHLNIDTSGPALPRLRAIRAEKIINPPDIAPTNQYWPNGKLKSSEIIVNGKVEGIGLYYHDNGQLYSEIPWKNGLKHGVYKLFRADGTLDQEISYVNGVLEGISREFDPAGSLLREQNYSNGTPVSKSTDPGIPLSIEVRRDVTTWSNFIWAMVLISVFPLLTWWRNRSFEMSRWSQSDFSPYYQGDDE